MNTNIDQIPTDHDVGPYAKTYIISPYLLIRTSRTAPKKYQLFLYTDGNTYNINETELSLIKDCKNPRTYGDLAKKYEAKTIRFAIRNKIIISEDEKWTHQGVNNLEIEISTHCNWNCEYCPQRFERKGKYTMPYDLFYKIIKDAQNVKQIKEINLNSYNEPTLVSDFYERVKLIEQSNLKLRLFTNATHLNDQLLKYFHYSNVLVGLHINFPSVERDKFIQMTGYQDYDHIIKIIETARKLNLPLELSVQGISQEKGDNIKKIKEKWPDITINDWPTIDRLGLVKGKYNQGVQIQTNILRGCLYINRTLCIDSYGNTYICCNDYHKVSVFDNIKSRSIEQILESVKLQEIRKTVFGCKEATDDFICKRCVIMKNNIAFSRLSNEL